MENGILRLLPGFRFHPTDEELIVHYLKRKVQSIPLPFPIPEADVCRSDPWSLPGDSQQERYFFSTVEIKYPNGKRSNRTATSGYWKPTGLDKKVVDSRNKQIGTKKTLVFYRSKPPTGSKTNWIMHEYKIANPTHGMENWVICRVFLKKPARKDVLKEEEKVEVQNRGSIFYEFIGGPRKFDLNLDGGGGDSSSSCSSGITVAGEDEEDSK
ncbi:hypothetical protein L1987_72502 [Smallanthus sonchifolius]|uniref:Uncharacterized protein n=1 Tax=Smallanthus sonchifolius TaxID=185202 RepID=A0ACB9AUZ5_9ASTR|nr:hypothetical protein L1987_72502 [Smallanthus sonchifolius]